MVIDIKMCRFDNVPWGFRLVGGADYEYPLTVVKVTEGSIAEEAGLCVEDVIVRINDTAATPLTHDEAHRLILSSGSVFYFGVHREHEELLEAPKRFPLSSSSLTKSPTPPPSSSGHSATASPLPLLTEATKALRPEQEREQEQVEVVLEEQQRQQQEAECRSAMPEMHSDGHSNGLGGSMQEPLQTRDPDPLPPCAHVDTLYLPDLPDRPCSALSEQTEIKLVEEEIAAVLSGETEVLKEHNVLGIFPKPGVCMTSDVLRSLNEEVTKTKLEKERENRKWSTFLQRPDRPVPKSKQQLEAERRAANAYKVKIVKSAPRDKSPMPETKPQPEKEPEPEPVPAPEPAKEASPPRQEEEQQEEEEEPLPTDSEVPNLEQLPDNGNGNVVDLPGDVASEQLEKADATKDEPQEEQEQQRATGSEEGQEAQASVAIADEPNEQQPQAKTDEELALEKQLADVQKQLAALSTLPSTIQSTLDAVTKQLAELLPTFKLQQQQGEKQQGEKQQGEEETPIDEEQQAEVAACENNEDKCDANDLEVAKISLSNGGSDDTGERDSAAPQHSAPQQPPLHDNEEEQSFKKQKIAFWNRLFNGGDITRQCFRELQSRSVSRVNFMKYQKPERKIDLNRSEVYKVIHHLDRAPVRGIEVRAPMVAAEEDIRQQATLQS